MLIKSRYPWYLKSLSEWTKWRLTYEGGQAFINTYLHKLSSRESDPDFESRKAQTYCPAFAAAVVDEIKNSIYQRMPDIKRVGGSKTYQQACIGELYGVDLDSSSMNYYLGTETLTELLIMSKVGILIDNASDLGLTLQDKGNKHPYLGMYPIESILCAGFRFEDNQKVLTSVLLRERVTEEDDYGLASKEVDRYRYMKLTPNGVQVEFYNDKNEQARAPAVLKLKRIPFVIMDIGRSLLQNVANYQIALMNLESSDIAYAEKSNFPFFYEFFDAKAEPPMKKKFNPDPEAGEAEPVETSAEAAVGPNHGRRYQKGLEAPGFTNPSPETLIASMKKEEQIKDDIRRVVNLNLEKIGAQAESGVSKQEGQRGLETSLSFIGHKLQKAEMQIAQSWNEFESGNSTTKITYPTSYSLKSDKERLEEIEQLEKRRESLPTKTGRRELSKKIVTLALGGDVTSDVLATIHKEIDSAGTLLVTTDDIVNAHKEGLIDDVTASDALGCDGKKVIPIAKEENVARLAAVAEAQGGDQSAARGGKGADNGKAADEKDGKEQRGKGAKVTKGE